MVNREYWDKNFHLFEVPRFECPNCKKGLLISGKDEIIHRTTRCSEQAYAVLGDPEVYSGYFSVILTCNNPDCQEITIVSGKTKVVACGWDDGHDPDTGDYVHEPQEIFKRAYTIEYVNPPIRYVEYPLNTPKEIVKRIEDSLKLFWVDEDSCGNKIRSSIEKLLDLQKINKKVINKHGKRQSLKLHQRIEEFKVKEPKIANYLFALKWIGNQGSHDSQPLTRREIIDAYKILEFSLFCLYDESPKQLDRLVKKINKHKRHKAE